MKTTYYNSQQPNVRYTKIIDFDGVREPVRYCDEVYAGASIDGWSISKSIDQDGRVKFSARKVFGKLRDDDFDPAEIEITVKSTKYKVPQIKAIKESNLIEIPDGKDRMSTSIEKARFIERHFRQGSILTQGEYLSEQFSEFDEILTIPKLNQITAKIKDEMANIQRERESYRVSK